jgi:hypothetical protein
MIINDTDTAAILKELMRNDDTYVIKQGMVYEGKPIKNKVIQINEKLKGGGKDFPKNNPWTKFVDCTDINIWIEDKKLKTKYLIQKSWAKWFYLIKITIEITQKVYRKSFEERAIKLVQLFTDNGVSEEFMGTENTIPKEWYVTLAEEEQRKANKSKKDKKKNKQQKEKEPEPESETEFEAEHEPDDMNFFDEMDEEFYEENETEPEIEEIYHHKETNQYEIWGEEEDEEPYETDYNNYYQKEEMKEEITSNQYCEDKEYESTELELLKEKLQDMIVENWSMGFRERTIEEKGFNEYCEELREIFLDDCRDIEPIGNEVADKDNQLLLRFYSVRG